MMEPVWKNSRYANGIAVLLLLLLHGALSDVPDDFVYTDRSKTVRMRDTVVLPCRFRGTPFAVYWKKGDDPKTAPNLVSWIPTDDVTGKCEGERPCQIMEMNENRSLVIKEIGIEEQGRYICRVSNYRGILIHNYTDISVIATPLEPFPVINECEIPPGSSNNTTCTIPSTRKSVMISCQASFYFPDIDLYFLHKSNRIPTVTTSEATNPDRTRNKTITTSASASEMRYFCLASNIPGLEQLRMTSIVIAYEPEASSTVTPGPIHFTTTYGVNQPTIVRETGGKGIKTAVPIVSIFIIAAIIVLFVLRSRLRKSSMGNYALVRRSPASTPQGKIEGKISFYELWILVRGIKGQDLARLFDTFNKLGILGFHEVTQDSAYNLLCKWKEDTSKKNEGLMLRNILHEASIEASWKGLSIRRQALVVSNDLLDHIVRSIEDPNLVDRFLHELNPNRRQTLVSCSKLSERGQNFATKALKELKRWRDDMRETTIDQNHLISLALERSLCQPLDRNFFLVPERFLKPISSLELERFVKKLTGRHCQRLCKAVGITDNSCIEDIIDKINDELFDTNAMIIKWTQKQECSNYERRCKLDDAIIRIGRHDMSDFFGTTSHRVNTGRNSEPPHPHANKFNRDSVFDDDLRMLLKFLPSETKEQFFEKVGIMNDEGRDDLQKLRDWRDMEISRENVCLQQDLIRTFNDVLTDTNFTNALDLKDEELANLAESIPSEKKHDLTSGLGIDVKGCPEKSLQQHLEDWRDNQEKETGRETLNKVLHEKDLSGCILDELPLGKAYNCEMVPLAYHLLCNDVGPLAKLLGMEMSRPKMVKKAEGGTVGLLIELLNESSVHCRRDFCVQLLNLGYMDAARLAFLGYEIRLSELWGIASELQQEEMDALADYLQVSRAEAEGWSFLQWRANPNQENLKLIMTWRQHLRTEPFHFRVELANALKAIKQTNIACRVLAGKYQTEVIRSEAIQQICSGLNNVELRSLAQILGYVRGYYPTQMNRSELIKHVEKAVKDRLNKTPSKTDTICKMFVSRKKQNDALFEAGFFELAQEIMLTEHIRFRSVKK